MPGPRQSGLRHQTQAPGAAHHPVAPRHPGPGPGQPNQRDAGQDEPRHRLRATCRQVHRDPKVDVERLVARWVDALLHGRAEDFVAVASEPFYFDQKVILTKSELRTAYEAASQKQGAGWRELEIQSIKIQTARELQGSGYDVSNDRIFTSLNLTLDDYTAIVTANYRGHSQGMLVVVRRVGDDYEIAGLWD